MPSFTLCSIQMSLRPTRTISQGSMTSSPITSMEQHQKLGSIEEPHTHTHARAHTHTHTQHEWETQPSAPRYQQNPRTGPSKRALGPQGTSQRAAETHTPVPHGSSARLKHTLLFQHSRG